MPLKHSNNVRALRQTAQEMVMYMLKKFRIAPAWLRHCIVPLQFGLKVSSQVVIDNTDIRTSYFETLVATLELMRRR